MKRRKFLKQAGLSSALLTTTGLPKILGSVPGINSPFTGKPRPEEWVEENRIGMFPLLREGRKTTWITGYTIPNTKRNWRRVDSKPLNMKFVETKRRPMLGSAAFDEEVTYCFSEIQTKHGPVRVDFLGNDIEPIIEMNLFVVELKGDLLGETGVIQQNATLLHLDWFNGIRKGKFAYLIKESNGFGPSAYQDAVFEIWERTDGRS
ncbi:MAG: hypothetical protein AB3N33_02795 [Puniceicoccaceae bacterium]